MAEYSYSINNVKDIGDSIFFLKNKIFFGLRECEVNFDNVEYFFKDGKFHIRFYNQKNNLDSELNSFFENLDIDSIFPGYDSDLWAKTESGKITGGSMLFAEMGDYLF